MGGTLSATGITGGVSINGTAYTITDWSTIFGTAGVSSEQSQVFGRPGAILTGDMLGLPYYLDLNLAILDLDTSGTLTEPTSVEQMQANTDVFLALLASQTPQYLEVDMPDSTSRFRAVSNLFPAPINQPRELRTIGAPMTDNWPYWHEGGNESTDTISGADTLVVGGNVNVYDAVLVFAGDGTFTHSGLGWAIQVIGSSGPVTVDLGQPDGGGGRQPRAQPHPSYRHPEPGSHLGLVHTRQQRGEFNNIGRSHMAQSVHLSATLAHPLTTALFTKALALIRVGVVVCEYVTPKTGLLPTISRGGATKSTSRILSPGDRLKMIGIHAGAVATEMVYHVAGRYVAHQVEIRLSMGRNETRRILAARAHEAPITILSYDASRPSPTIARRIHLRPKAFLCGHGNTLVTSAA